MVVDPAPLIQLSDPRADEPDAIPQEKHDLSLFRAYQNASEITYSPENALKDGLGMVQTMKKALKHLEFGSKLREEVWKREIMNLEGQGTPKTLIAVCGATGAGKSSILNAILDDNIVPTSGMRACTAVVTELAYHEKSTIDADISFLSEVEWRDELKVLLHDLVDEDGNIKRSTDLKSDAGIAWQKVHAVYPNVDQDDLVKMSVDQILGYDQQISRILGTTKTISAKDSKSFAKEIGKYIDSKDQKRGSKDKSEKKKEPSLMDQVRKSAGMGREKTKSGAPDADSAALWPLIRQVNVRCRAEALSTGAVLVDLPGVADANAARNNIAKDYMKKCNCIWILAPITRAVDDKTARDLLGDAFKIQLMMGELIRFHASWFSSSYVYDDHAITFIASKCDDISCSEVIKALRLESDPVLEDIEERLELIMQNTSACKRKKREAEHLVKELKDSLQYIRDQINDDQKHLDAMKAGEPFISTLKRSTKNSNGKKRKNSSGGRKGSSKRRRSTLDNDDEDDEINSESEISESESESESDSSDDSDMDEDHSSDSGYPGSNQDEEDVIEEVTTEVLEQKIMQSKASIRATREALNDARNRKKDAIDELSSLEKSRAKVQREKNAFCSLKRSEFSRDVLKEDFRIGLKDLDDAAAEEKDPLNFNPNVDARDYSAIDLPVFTCSSRDYVRLKGQVKGDGKPICFSNVKDTGIPDLQQWCHQLTIASRERSARSFMAHIQTFAQSVQSYVQGIGDITAIDRESLRAKWESRKFDEDLAQRSHTAVNNPLQSILGGLGAGLGAGLYPPGQPVVQIKGHNESGISRRLCIEFAKLVDGCVHDLQTNFKDGLEDKCRIGAANAADAALNTVDEFTSSMHWATYRATLRRHGSWRRDLNAELIQPFTRNIAHSWSQVFESDLFGPFQASTLAAIRALVKEVEETAATGLKERARLQGNACVEEARIALANTVELVKVAMTSEQKEISRCMAPHVQAQLVEGYDTAMLERGTGSVARQKAYFRGYLNNCKDDIFDDGANVVMERLTKAADTLGETLDEAMGKLAEKIEVNLAVLWEGARDNPEQLRARQAMLEIVQIIKEQVKIWIEADKIKQQTSKIQDAMEED
ncbi:Nuclear GTPase SLIP-GC [Psilocybe cubensis]|uniref:Nuclear GTPase SLIP-GC n=2 Tax=Psilocybe cubensis TaxID=181762 RepID=A0ACB8H4Y1_PSICU|nr:Nuclear GTPase SLIP-GC [Psilocybe cubensis]KAH9482911.1 Nuclear GTPase SLIP-GC [Psilocybe cubensis]